MPYGASSPRNDSRNPRTANFVGAYAVYPNTPTQPGRRRHAHDASAPAFDHPGHHRAHDVDRAEVVDVHHLAEQVGVELPEVTGPGLARGAHRDVDGTLRVGERGDRDGDLRGVGHVGGRDRHVHVCRAQGRRGLVEHVRAARHQRDTRPRSPASRAVARPIPLDPPVIRTWAPENFGMAAERTPASRPEGKPAPTGAAGTCRADDSRMDIASLLGDDADSLLSHVSKGIPKEDLHLPGPDFVDRVWAGSDRPVQVLRNLQQLYAAAASAAPDTCRSCPSTRASSTPAAASFAPNPALLRPGEHRPSSRSRAAATRWPRPIGVLGSMSRKYAHKIPFIVKLNHNELMTLPNKFDQIMFGSVEQAYDLGAAGVGATIYFGSDEATRQIQEVAAAFAEAHELGMFTVLWCYLRNSEFKQGDIDYHVAADLTGQANHLGVTIEADIIKQKLPENNGGYNAFKGYGKTSKLVYDTLTTDHPIDLTR